VGLVTPMRDGMNLVAKEYVAAQDPEDPGVLVLSRFAGAADEFRAALLVNPYDPDAGGGGHRAGPGDAQDGAQEVAMPPVCRAAGERHSKWGDRAFSQGAATPTGKERGARRQGAARFHCRA